MKNSEKTLDMIVNLCKNRGFVYAGSEIYGGLANAWDYGPLGVEFKNNVKNYGPLGVEFKNNVKKAWLKKFVQESDYNVGLDAAILMNPQTWITTGHVGSFSDPLVDCKGCGARQRADKLIEAAPSGQGVNADAMSFEEMERRIREVDRTVTYLDSRGGYSQEPSETMLCVVRRFELHQLQTIIREEDKHAFVIVGEAGQVTGEGSAVSVDRIDGNAIYDMVLLK